MENNPKKSKAFIITFIIILLLLIVGYYFIKNREQIFGTKGSLSVSKIFSPLLGTPKGKGVNIITDTPPTKTAATSSIDAYGNKIVLAEAGENLKKGDAVYITGFNDNKNPIVLKAIANDKTKALVLGVAAEDILKGQMGDIMIEGKLTGVTTNYVENTSWAVGNPLNLSDKIPGGMTKTEPAIPSLIVPIGGVFKVDAIDGIIYIGNLADMITTNSDGNKIIQSEAGENLKRCDAVYEVGFNSNNKPIVMRAIANDKNKSHVLGIAGQDTVKGAMVDVIVSGKYNCGATNRKEGTLWAVNNTLFLSDRILGGMTKNSPKAPSLVVAMASVYTVAAKNGMINLDKLNSNLLGDFGKALNSDLLQNYGMNISDYWNSIFGNNSYKGFIYDANTPTNYNVGEFPWVPVTPPGGVCHNSATNYPECTTKDGQCLDTTKTNPPACTTDKPNVCDNTATNYPECTTKDGQCLDTTKTNPPLCNNTITTEPNKCLLVEQNPLTFTPEEKARLAVLLRKFYLISSTLKTTDDISTIYNEIDQQKNFINQIQSLTKQCYDQIPENMTDWSSPYGWRRHGNPWYSKSNKGTSPYSPVNQGYSDGDWLIKHYPAKDGEYGANIQQIENLLNTW